MPDFQQRLQLLQSGSQKLLSKITRGIEKESLRVTPSGKLARTPHPRALGSTLTHPEITTDYAEPLLEFITPPSSSIDELLNKLDELHRLTYQHIDDELLWVDSMPCQLGDSDDIPVALYGNSNIGRMKTIYRIGLGHRYGRPMQTIAGIHYNFSLPETFWQWLQQQEAPGSDLQTFKTERYFGLIRNFRRYFWLLLYLFGASPAVCRSFVKGRDHGLTPFEGDEHSLHSPTGTSLRMGDLGYQSDAQQSLIICYNSLDNYVRTLLGALTEPHPDYQAIGLKDAEGNHLQLSDHLLQIENEFYSVIRPKRTTRPGETPLSALKERGVEYIEVRCLDLNPYHPLGIDEQQIRFLDAFLLYCLLADSPETDVDEYRSIVENQRRAVYGGRHETPFLLDRTQPRDAHEWAEELFDGIRDTATLLDKSQSTNAYSSAVTELQKLLHQPELTPSGKILAEMREQGKTYFQVAMDHAQQHRNYFLQHPLSEEKLEQYRIMAEQSLSKQKELEANDQQSLDDFLKDYYLQYNALLKT